jgi:hypothetical protein
MTHLGSGVCIAAVEDDWLIFYSINLVGADQLAPSAPLTDPGQSDILQPSAIIGRG